jgi:hypothetical protein
MGLCGGQEMLRGCGWGLRALLGWTGHYSQGCGEGDFALHGLLKLNKEEEDQLVTLLDEVSLGCMSK